MAGSILTCTEAWILLWVSNLLAHPADFGLTSLDNQFLKISLFVCLSGFFIGCVSWSTQTITSSIISQPHYTPTGGTVLKFLRAEFANHWFKALRGCWEKYGFFSECVSDSSTPFRSLLFDHLPLLVLKYNKEWLLKNRKYFLNRSKSNFTPNFQFKSKQEIVQQRSAKYE